MSILGVSLIFPGLLRECSATWVVKIDFQPNLFFRSLWISILLAHQKSPKGLQIKTGREMFGTKESLEKQNTQLEEVESPLAN